MENKTRRQIYLVSFFLFAILAIVLILITRGYHFNFKEGRIYQAVIVVIDSNPEGAEIYINSEKCSEKTPVTLKDISAGDYTISLQKENYHPVKKHITVNTKEVNRELESVELFLEEPTLNQITSKNTENFWLSPDQKKVVYLTNKESKQKLWLLNLDKNKVTEISTKGINFIALKLITWSPKNNQFILGINNHNYYLGDLDKKTLIQIPNFPWEIKKAEWHPQDEKRLYLLLGRELYLFNLEAKQSSRRLILSNVTGFKASGNSLYCIIKKTSSIYNTKNTTEENASQEEINELWSFDLSGEKQKLITQNLPQGEVEKILIRNNHKLLPKEKQFIILVEGKNLETSLIVTEKTDKSKTDTITEIDVKVNDYFSSKNEEELIYQKQNEIYVYNFETKEKILVTRTKERITGIFLHPKNPNYFYFKTKNHLKAIDETGSFTNIILNLEENSSSKIDLVSEGNYFLILSSQNRDQKDIYQLDPQ
ncbi:PEGA domain-containing protein, partial [Patescibacteria group bacterium]